MIALVILVGRGIAHEAGADQATAPTSTVMLHGLKLIGSENQSDLLLTYRMVLRWPALVCHWQEKIAPNI